jgi:hypothetical protein
MAFEEVDPIKAPNVEGPLTSPFTFRMDKSFHRAQTFDQAEYMSVDTEGELSYVERLARCTYLNRVGYGYAHSGLPKMDKDVFRVRRRQ